MGRAKTLRAVIMRDDGVLFDSICSVLFVPSTRDTIAIMPEHTPLIMKLGKGEIRAISGRNIVFHVETTSGVLYVADNHASVLVNA